MHYSGEEETAVLLLERGADPRRPSAIRQRTPLHMAALGNHLQVLQVLLQMDVDVNAKVSVILKLLWIINVLVLLGNLPPALMLHAVGRKIRQYPLLAPSVSYPQTV